MSAVLPTVRARRMPWPVAIRRTPDGPVEPIDSEGLTLALLDHLAGRPPGLTVYTSTSRRSS